MKKNTDFVFILNIVNKFIEFINLKQGYSNLSFLNEHKKYKLIILKFQQKHRTISASASPQTFHWLTHMHLNHSRITRNHNFSDYACNEFTQVTVSEEGKCRMGLLQRRKILSNKGETEGVVKMFFSFWGNENTNHQLGFWWFL